MCSKLVLMHNISVPINSSVGIEIPFPLHKTNFTDIIVHVYHIFIKICSLFGGQLTKTTSHIIQHFYLFQYTLGQYGKFINIID